MKYLIIFLSIIQLQLIAQKKFKVELEFRYKQPYCGNAKPTPKQYEAATIERPLDKQTFYIFQNNKCVDTLITNDSGKVVVKYLPGEYFLFEPWKVLKKTPDGSSITDFHKTCLVKEWAKPNYKLTIKEDDFTLDYYEISASRCSNQLACLRVRHLPKLIKR